MPNVLLIATGGTIAGTAPSPTLSRGYRPAALPVSALLESLPDVAGLAAIVAEQPFSIGSQHLTSHHWLQLAARVRAAACDAGVDGIVVTHGTDTMEETALFLDMACPRDKPVVLTGAMRPATATSADGPLNLFNAVALAADPSSRGAGALVLMNDQVFAADRAAKLHTIRVDAFGARDGGAVASMVEARPHWLEDPAGAGTRRPTLLDRLAALPAELPRVDIVHQHVDADAGVVDWLRGRGSRAMVVAGTGNGTASQPMLDALARASADGCLVIRASRVAHGPVVRDGGVPDTALGFVAAGRLSPHKARVAAMLALAAGLQRDDVQRLFDGF
jgi:L-asparaginase